MIDAPSAVHQFVAALAARDFDAMQSTLGPNVQFRALIPPGMRSASTPSEARAAIEAWFVDSDEFEMVQRSVETIGDRLHGSYRIHGRENGERYVCQQQIYATLEESRIVKLDVMCSGFRPRM